VSGIHLTQTDDYDEIFAALKHPVRRQILLFIEEKGEASFTQIQSMLGVADTGLISYHLKELSPLIEQSERGKYRLSEVGQAGVELFRKVERDRQRSSGAVQTEIERFLNKSIIASMLFLGIAALTLGVPVSIDILVTVQSVTHGFTLFQVASAFLVSFLVMVLGVALFTVYDLHYYSKTTKKSIIHSTVFALGVNVLVGLVFIQLQSFADGLSGANSVIPGYFGVLQAVGLLASAPMVAYAVSKTKAKGQK
jgi:DNA-binding transcriptional ArsR family regulator